MAIDVSAITSAGALEQRTSFMLNESAGGWIVRSGTLEVFAVKDLNGKPDGPLRPLFSVNAGQAVFGLAGVERLPLTLVARRSVESEVVSWPSGSFRQIDMAGGGSLLAEWVAALSLVAARDLVPRNVVTLTHGEHLKAEDEARLVSSKDPLIWARQTSGSSRFLERPDLAISKGAPPYPLSPFAWIGLQPHSELTIVDSLASLTDEEISRGTALFHRSALICIARTANEADEQERERFRSRADADARAVQTALDDLASPLEPGREHLPAGTDTLDSPLLRACQMIGQRLGVTMRPHPDMVSGRVVKNPVEAIAQASGVRYRRVALKDRWMKKSSEPLLVFRDADERPAALLPRGARGYSIYDPAVGKPTPLDRATAETLNPFAFMFYRPFPNRALAPWDLIEFGFKDGRRELLTIVLMSSSAGILALLVPYVTGVVFDTIIPNAQRTELITVAALLIVAALVTTLLNLGRSFAVLRLQGKLSLSLQSALWDRLLSLPLPFFRQYASGDLAQRSAAFSLIRDVLSGSVLSAILSGIFSVFSFALLFYYSPRLALIATAMTLVALVVTGTAGMMQLRLQRKISMTMGHIAGIVVEFISGIAKFRIAGAERRAFVLWVREFAEQKRLGFESNTVSTVVAVFNAVYVSACLGVLFLLNSGVEAWRDDALSTGQFLAFMAAFAQFMAATLAMGQAFVGIVSVVPLYERASPILLALPEVKVTQTSPGELKGEVQASHLVFRYVADGPVVVRDVSFHIRPGEYAAFVGPSGCGKSTIFRLLLGFETPLSGSVSYDGADLAGLDAQAVRRQIGVVLQSGTLLAGSIMANISGAASLPVEEVWQAARMAGMEEDIKNMPMGLHTVVQAGGGGVSGGQRQRILIARAVVSKPRVLFFDEATSALDNRTQAIVTESLKTLKATRIVIAHRLSTILSADRIFVMEQGRIVQTGRYEELIEQPGLFRELAQRQLT